MTTYTHMDLCCGTGAFTHALACTGTGTSKVSTIYANDLLESSKEIYDLNFTTKLTLGDLNTIPMKNIPKANIMTCGFPCQSFSIAGKQLGFEDDRSNVFWTLIKIMKNKKPDCVVMENVKNLLSHDDGKSFETVKSSIEKAGYHMKYAVLNTADITGIPQHRERVYMVCFRKKEMYDKFEFDFPIIAKKKITDFLEKSVAPKYYYTDKSKIWPMLSASVTSTDTVYQYRRVYVRENKNNECPTLTQNMGSGGHNVPIIKDAKGIRKLTPRECFNLQGFPATYKLPTMADSHLYKLAGNAVTCEVVKLIANKIINIISE